MARVGARLELGLCDGGLERHVPQTRSRGLVGLPAREVADERGLGDLLRARPDGLVVVRPVDGQPEVAPQRLEALLILLGEAQTQLDEVLAADRDLVGGLDGLAVPTLVRRGEPGLVGQRGVAAHAVVVLDAALGGQAVVVPAHGVEHLTPAHALEAGDDVGVRVGEDVTDVEGAGHGGRRGVDRVDLLAAGGAVEGVGATVGPDPVPLRLEAVEGHLLRGGGVGERGGAVGQRVVLRGLTHGPDCRTDPRHPRYPRPRRRGGAGTVGSRRRRHGVACVIGRGRRGGAVPARPRRRRHRPSSRRAARSPAGPPAAASGGPCRSS